MVETVRLLDVFEVFSEIEKSKNRKAKIKVLQDNNRMPIRDVLQGTFDDNIQWKLPGGTPPYTPQVEGPPPPSSLIKEHLKFKYFVKGLQVCENLSDLRRERMFIDILESIHPKDAEILVSMVNKKLEVTGLTKKLVQEAYPDLIPD